MTLRLAPLALALAALPAAAQGLPFVLATGAADPFPPPLTLPGGWDLDLGPAGPTFVDLEGDGDMDMISTETARPFGGTSVSYLFLRTPEGFGAPAWLGGWDLYPVLDDFDGDGDLDAFGNRAFQSPGRYFEQTPAWTWVLRTGAANPFSVYGLPYYDNSLIPAVGDVDGDGDHDVIAVGGARILYARRDGPGVFTPQADAANPLAGLWDGTGSPTLVDMDADGDDDLVVGRAATSPLYFEHTASGAFVAAAHPVTTLPAGGRLTLADLDVDGDADAVVGRDGRTYHYERTAEGFVLRDGLYDLLGGFGLSRSSVMGLAVADADGDGDDDLLVGHVSYAGGNRWVFRMAFLQRLPGDGPRDWRIGGPNVFEAFEVERTLSDGHYLRPAVVDLDADGDFDVVIGLGNGRFRYVEQTAPGAFTERTAAANPFDGIDLGSGAAPAFGDADGDGDLDLVSAGYPYARPEWGQPLHYFERTGPAAFTPRTGPESPLYQLDALWCAPSGGHPTLSGAAVVPSFVDVDNDEDLDLMSGRCLFRNEAGRFSPVYADNPFVGLPPYDAYRERAFEVVTYHDVSGDGVRDVVELYQRERGPYGAPFTTLGTYFGTGTGTASEPGTAAPADPLALTAPVPNPAAGTTRLTLTVHRAQRVRAALFDPLGRRVAGLHDGPVGAGETVTLAVDATALPPGIYLVRVVGWYSSASRLLTVAR